MRRWRVGPSPVSSVFEFPVRALTPAPVVFMVEVQQKRRCVAHPEARPCSKPEVLSSHLQMRCPMDLCHDRGPMGPGFWGLEQALSPSVRKTLRGRAQAVNMRIGAGSAHSNQLTPRKIQKTNKNTKKNKCKKQKKQKKINKKANITKKTERARRTSVVGLTIAVMWATCMQGQGTSYKGGGFHAPT